MRFVILSLVLTGLILADAVLAQEPNRGVSVTSQAIQGSVPIAGDYWAIIIGINHYHIAPSLESAVRDATAVRDVLLDRYGFRLEHIIQLLDEEATRTNIEDALYQVGRQAGAEDSLLIYYAGHGQYDEDGSMGWWVPVEGDPKKPGTFITNASIRDYLRGMKAKHVYLVADSCFSGTLFGTRALPPISDKFFGRLYAKRSRWGLTSGGTEPVADKGREGHSAFAYHFIALLRENTSPYLIPSHIYDQLAPVIANNADQTPRSEPIKGAGDDGGQFVLRLAAVAKPATDGPTGKIPRIINRLEGLFSHGIKLKVSLNKKTYREGEEMVITVHASRDAYIHIFNLGQDNEITVLLPNRYTQRNFAKSGKSLYFPDEVDRETGLRLRLFLPASFASITEKIKVVATRRNVDLVKGKIREGVYQVYSGKDSILTDLSKELSLLDESDWAEATLPYEIQK